MTAIISIRAIFWVLQRPAPLIGHDLTVKEVTHTYADCSTVDSGSQLLTGQQFQSLHFISTSCVFPSLKSFIISPPFFFLFCLAVSVAVHYCNHRGCVSGNSVFTMHCISMGWDSGVRRPDQKFQLYGLVLLGWFYWWRQLFPFKLFGAQKGNKLQSVLHLETSQLFLSYFYLLFLVQSHPLTFIYHSLYFPWTPSLHKSTSDLLQSLFLLGFLLSHAHSGLPRSFPSENNLEVPSKVNLTFNLPFSYYKCLRHRNSSWHPSKLLLTLPRSYILFMSTWRWNSKGAGEAELRWQHRDCWWLTVNVLWISLCRVGDMLESIKIFSVVQLEPCIFHSQAPRRVPHYSEDNPCILALLAQDQSQAAVYLIDKRWRESQYFHLSHFSVTAHNAKIFAATEKKNKTNFYQLRYLDEVFLGTCASCDVGNTPFGLFV